MSFEDKVREEARLIILKALAAEVNNRLNSELLRLSLESFGIDRTRDFVHAELGHLRDVGAVDIAEASTVHVATLTQRGMDHVMRRVALPGVKRPSLGN